MQTIQIKCETKLSLPLDDLHEFQGNLKSLSEDDFHKLKNQILETGFAFPILAWNDGTEWKCLGGHQRIRVLKKLREEGYEIPLIPVVAIQAKDLKEAKKRILQDVGQFGRVDPDGLYEFITQSDIGIDELIEDFRIPDINLEDFELEFFKDNTVANGDEDEVPDAPLEPKTKRGDLWILGGHRVLCGDSTLITDVDKLMGGEKADMVFTDPPYGMRLDTEYNRENWGDRPNNHSGGNQGNNYRKVAGDHDDFTPELIHTVFAAFSDCAEVFLWGADYYAEHIPDRNDGSWIVWDKVTNRHGEESGCAAFHGSNFELCWSRSRHKRDLARVMHKGLASVEKDKRVHPTQKPVQLAEWFFERWGQDGDKVVDLFGGSGSTLIACEKTGRKCFMMELDAVYCDVILQRFANYSGKDPVRDDGVKWSDLSGEFPSPTS